MSRPSDKPRKPANGARASGSRRVAPSSAARARPSILLVDDHAPNLTALEEALEPLGVRLLRASSGADAVAIAGAEDLALVLVDLQMPELDGLETAALLKKTERGAAVPIIIVTAREPTRAEVVEGYASGAVDFVAKPVDPDVLRSKVTAFLELYRQRSVPPARASETRGAASGGEEPSGRLSERLLAAAHAEDPAETVEAVMRIHSALSEDLDLDKIAGRLAVETCSLARARGAAFHYDLRGAARVSACGAMNDAVRAIAPSSPLLAKVVARREVARHGDLRGPIRSMLAVPVVTRAGDVDGALVLVSDRTNAFDARDEELATVAAAHAAAAVENARLYEEARAARHRAELAELELRAGEARLRLALDSVGLGTWDFNPRTGALRLDARAQALFGLADAPANLASFIEAVHPDDRAHVGEALKAALDPSGGALDVELRTARGAGTSVRWVAAKGQAIVGENRTVRFIGTVLDVTTKRRIEDERAALLARECEARAVAESASRAKDEFLATVSHELRNPLNAILGWSRVLLDEPGYVSNEHVMKGLEVIARNAKAQVQLVEDILEVSRIITGKLRLTTASMEVRQAVEGAVETVRAAAEAKGVIVETCFEDEPRTIVADEDRVQQILWNLLSNAVKFTPRGGRVRLLCSTDADDALFTVSDTGEGIEPDFLPHVFERFRQADGSPARRFGGLGLGLAIVRHLVEQHGGAVSARSDGRGKGAAFVVRLPIRGGHRDEGPPPPSTARSQTLTSAAPSTAPLAGRAVLVLDDEEDMRDLIAMILENAGARVVRAPDVGAAVRVVESDGLDVAVSDLAMPGEDGYAFVRRVRSLQGPPRSLPLVAMTAYARAEDRHRVLDAGFDRHVAKPIEPSQLVSAIADLLAARG